MDFTKYACILHTPNNEVAYRECLPTYVVQSRAFYFRYFRGGGGELPPEMLEGASESLKKSKVKKKKSSGKDWTWKDQVDMVKWTDRMINVSPLTHQSLNKNYFPCLSLSL